VSSAAYSKNRVAKTTRMTRQASVTVTRSERNEPRSTVIDMSGDSVSWTLEGTEDPQESVDAIEQSGAFVWDEEESQALRQARKDAELTTSFYVS
jgi:hypothetical protein